MKLIKQEVKSSEGHSFVVFFNCIFAIVVIAASLGGLMLITGVVLKVCWILLRAGWELI